MPYCLQGRLHWRGAQWTPSERAYRRSHELAEQVGWSEVCVDALHGLAATLSDRGDVPAAEAVLAQALEICDRAGLTVQSIQAMAALALLQAGAGRSQAAEETARAAVELAEQVGYPVGKAAGLEASSLLAGECEGAAELGQAREAWTSLGRPLEAARCELLLGQRLLERDPDAARAVLERARAEFDRLGVGHRAARARELAGARQATPW
jgi:tetratricopeptide (TPR) repeat protein